MSDFISLDEQSALLDRVISQAALLRAATANWTRVRDKTKRYLGRIVDEDLHTLFQTFSSKAFSDILLGDDFPTLESLLQLPDAFSLDPIVRREHFVVYLAVWQQDGEIHFALYTGSGAALKGSDTRIRSYVKVVEKLDDYYDALFEALEEGDQGPNDLEFPTFGDMAVKVLDHIEQGFRLVHLGVAFLVKRTGPHGLTHKVLHPWLRCWILVLEALVNYGLWTPWLGEHSMDPDDQRIRFLCPWNVHQRPYIGLNLSNPLFEFVEEASADRVTFSQRRHQRLVETRKLLANDEISESDERVQELNKWTAYQRELYHLPAATTRRETRKSRLSEARRRVSENDPTATESDPEIQYLQSQQAINKKSNSKKRDQELKEPGSDVSIYNQWQNERYTKRVKMAASAEARLKAKDPTATESDAEVKVLRSVTRDREQLERGRQARNANNKILRTSALERLRRGDPTATESDDEVKALRKHEAQLLKRRQNRAAKNAKDVVVLEDEDDGDEGATEQDEENSLETNSVRPSKKRKLDQDVSVLRENGNGLAGSE